MLAGRKLRQALEDFTPKTMTGTGFRNLDLRYVNSPLSGLGAKLTGARFTPKGAFEMLYVSLSRTTAELEVGSLIQSAQGLVSIKLPPRVTVSVEYRLSSVLDLTDMSALERLGTNPQEFYGPWKPMTAGGMDAPTQALGRAVRQGKRFEAMLVPSAQDPVGLNLAIFTDRLQPGSWARVYDPHGTITVRLEG